MQLFDIVETSSRVAEAKGRKEKIRHLATCLRRMPTADLATGTAFLAGYLPQGRMGLGPATLKRSLPDTAAAVPELSLARTGESFSRITGIKGPGSTARRLDLLRALLTRATGPEQEFLVKLILGELRQGALEGLIIEAIASAAGVPGDAVRRAWMLANDPGAVADAALSQGIPGLSRFKLRIFSPILPMLAASAEDMADALNQLRSAAALEFKLDGARVQVHKSGDDVRVFTRRLNDVTAAVPEVVQAARQIRSRTAVLDGEVLAMRADGSPHPFQMTMRRFGRRLDVDQLRDTLPLAALYFDCLHLDDHDLIDLRAAERFEALTAAVGTDLLIPRVVTGDAAEAEAFMDAALKQGHEGVMAKALDAPYLAGNRGSDWLKIKRTYTLDLVVLAAERGSGRRSGWLSNLHLGARDPASGNFVMLGKTFKGMTDQMLAWQTEHFEALTVARDGTTCYVRPELVVEIAFNDIQASQRYPAGLALRFARVKRYRTDKSPAQADTIDTVRAIYARQVDRAADTP